MKMQDGLRRIYETNLRNLEDRAKHAEKAHILEVRENQHKRRLLFVWGILVGTVVTVLVHHLARL
jgi:hypothetical protein